MIQDTLGQSHQSLFGSSAYVDKDGNSKIDVGGILRRILLFDTYILKSVRLKEIPKLVDQLGLVSTITLLKSNAIQIHLDALTTAQIGQTGILQSRQEKGVLPLGSFCFTTVMIPNRREYISGCFRESIDPIPVSIKDRQTLKHAVLDAIVEPPDNIGTTSLEQLKIDLRNQTPTLRLSTSNQLYSQFGIKVSPDDLEIKLHPIDDEDFVSESNLNTKCNLDLTQQHKVIELAALGLAGVNQRIAEMRSFDALSGFRVNDLPLFESKTAFIVNSIDPDNQEKLAQRVFESVELPDFSDISSELHFDMDSFLAIRQSDECREFRQWLPTIDQASDQEILERVSNLRAKIASFTSSTTGRAFRFLTTSILGAVEPVTGLAVGALDAFIVDRIFKESKVVTFVSRMYPSLYE